MPRMPLILMACLILVGCGGQPHGQIDGTVKYKGEPVPYAIVIVFADDQQVYRADTDQSGNFKVSGVPYGKARVAVQRPMLESEAPPIDDHKDAPGSQSSPIKNLPKIPTIPGRYADPKTSNLTVDLADANQRLDIDLN